MIDLKDLYKYKNLLLPTGEQNEDLADSSTDTYCSHTWKLYKGFSEWYYYCDRCDLKKDYDGKVE